MKAGLVFLSMTLLLNGAPNITSWDFDNLKTDTLPAGWKVEATGQDQPSAAWSVQKNDDAPLGPGVLQLTETNHTVRGVFNICWTNEVQFLEGEIAVFLRARSGKIDQGGGIIWRVQDRNNYYISRYNPLEKNVSIYYVRGGKRVTLAYSGTLDLSDGWHVFRIRHQADTIRAYIDGEMMLRANSGEYIKKTGGVGLWTKADAATSFDNFTVIPRTSE